MDVKFGALGSVTVKVCKGVLGIVLSATTKAVLGEQGKFPKCMGNNTTTCY